MELSLLLSLFITLLITIHFFISWWRQYKQYKILPPGPTPIPLLGTPKYLNIQTVYKDYTKLSQKYGPIFTIWMLSEPMVVLCGYETVREALVNHAEEFSARPIIPTLDFPTNGYDVNGPRWRNIRRFIISSLRTIGMGKKTMESRVLEEATYVNQLVSEMEGKPFNPMLILSCAVGNIMSSVLFGEHFDYKDPKFHDLMMRTSRHLRAILTPLYMICNIFPFLLKLPILPNIIFKEQFYLQKFVLKYIEEHKRTLNPEAPRDFIDHYLLKTKEVEHEEDPDFCVSSLPYTVVGLLSAGSETTASTLKFILVFIAHYPDVQVKVQKEIDEVTQSLRPPTFEDRAQMPYTHAVIHEIQRILDLVSTAFFHSVTKDVQLHGYTIPKGTTIIPFLTSVLYDPSQWETPEQFNPEHFLDGEGQFRNRGAFMPFSAGKRVCAGENLARMMLFLLFSALLQKFTLKLPPGAEPHESKWLYANKNEIIMNTELCAIPRTLATK
ncbi:cytochrome P450 2C29-like isoform X2 [Pyxicephalus adspersus]